MLRRNFIKANLLIIIVLITGFGLGSSVIVSAKDDAKENKLLGNMIIVKEKIKELEEIVKAKQPGALREKIEEIKKEFDKMLDDKNKSIEQREEELSKAVEEAKQKRIKEIEEKLNEKARKEKARKNIK